MFTRIGVSQGFCFHILSSCRLPLPLKFGMLPQIKAALVPAFEADDPDKLFDYIIVVCAMTS